jgi:hypothetical protein
MEELQLEHTSGQWSLPLIHLRFVWNHWYSTVEISSLLSNRLMQFTRKKPKRSFMLRWKKYAMKNTGEIHMRWPKRWNNADGAARRIHQILLILVWMGQLSWGLPLQNKKWPLYSETTPGPKNVAHPPLVDKSEICLPSLHIQRGLLKVSVKSAVKEWEGFVHLW